MSVAVGFPYDETPAPVVLWRTLRSLPVTIRQHETQFVEMQRSFDEATPFLRVARLDAPTSYERTDPATVEFPGRAVPGILAIAWDGSRLSGSLEHQAPVQPGPVTLESTPGLLRGSETFGQARFANGMVEGLSGEFMSLGGSTTSTFEARRLTVTDRVGSAVFHRYCFRGGRLRGWASQTQRITSRSKKAYRFEARRDSFDVSLFDRRARITQVHDDEGDQRKQVLGVTIDGAPLDERGERLLWLMVSFIAGNRVQPIAIEHFDADAVRMEVTMLNAVDYGERAIAPPFDLRIAEPTFHQPDITRLIDGIGTLDDNGFPIAQALHHLHDANTGYTQVDLKNLLFCIHTLFEAWSDKNDQREIIKESQHKRLRRTLSPSLDAAFGVNTEIREAVAMAIRNANNRVGAQLQEVFFDSLGVVLSESDLRALRRRNSLFHNGYLVPEKGKAESAFHQELYDDSSTLRTLAHIAILKLTGYSGAVFDYRTWSTIWISSDNQNS
jgi:hypothetical protein